MAVGPAEKHVRAVTEGSEDAISKLTDEDLHALLVEIGAMRRAMHPLVQTLGLGRPRGPQENG